LAVGSWPFRRHEPERRVLARLYLELARLARADPQVHEAPPASAEITEARTALTTRSGDPSIESERYMALMSQAERIRLSLIALARLRGRVGRDEGAVEDAATIDQSLQIASLVLTSVGDSLSARELTPAHRHPREFEELRKLSAALRHRQCGTALAGMLRDARWQVDAL